MICGDWQKRKSAWEQQRWEYLIRCRVDLSKEDANAWADAVWPNKEDTEEIEGDAALGVRRSRTL